MKFEIEIEGRIRKVEVERLAAGNSSKPLWQVLVDGEPAVADAHLLRPGVLSLILDGRSYRIVLEEAPGNGAEDPAVHVGSRRMLYRAEDPRSLKSRRARATSGDGPKTLRASMPGRVIRVLAAAGDEVKQHQGIVVIEAMKMQNELKAPKDGRITEMRVAPGDTVSSGDTLAVIE